MVSVVDSRISRAVWQFTSQQRDPNSGLDYLRARYYDTTTGRFLTRDPMPGEQTAPQTWNQYVYALNNPTSRIDHTGMDSETLGIPRACVKLAAGIVFAAIAPGLLFTVPAPFLLPLEIMYVYAAAFVVTTELLQAYQEANTTGQAVSSLDLASEITQALGQSKLTGLLAGLPALVVDFVNCVQA